MSNLLKKTCSCCRTTPVVWQAGGVLYCAVNQAMEWSRDLTATTGGDASWTPFDAAADVRGIYASAACIAVVGIAPAALASLGTDTYVVKLSVGTGLVLAAALVSGTGEASTGVDNAVGVVVCDDTIQVLTGEQRTSGPAVDQFFNRWVKLALSDLSQLDAVKTDLVTGAGLDLRVGDFQATRDGRAMMTVVNMGGSADGAQITPPNAYDPSTIALMLLDDHAGTTSVLPVGCWLDPSDASDDDERPLVTMAAKVYSNAGRNWLTLARWTANPPTRQYSTDVDYLLAVGAPDTLETLAFRDKLTPAADTDDNIYRWYRNPTGATNWVLRRNNDANKLAAIAGGSDTAGSGLDWEPGLGIPFVPWGTVYDGGWGSGTPFLSRLACEGTCLFWMDALGVSETYRLVCFDCQCGTILWSLDVANPSTKIYLAVPGGGQGNSLCFAGW